MGKFDFLNNDITIAEERKRRRLFIIIIIAVITVASVIVVLAITKKDDPIPVIPEKINVKIDKKKDYLYKAEYTTSAQYNISNITLPYINIDNNTATDANNEIKALFESLTATNPNSTDTDPSYAKSNYTYYKNNNLLSVLVTVEKGNNDNITYDYYTYNFSLISLVNIEYQALYKEINMSTKDVQAAIEQKITDKINESYSTQLEKDTLTNDINESINAYKAELYNEKLKMYLDENGLNVILRLKNSKVENQFFTTTITIPSKVNR